MIYEPKIGVSFYDAVKALKLLLVKEQTLYKLMIYNGIHVTVSVDSNPDDIATIYDLKKKLHQIELKSWDWT